MLMRAAVTTSRVVTNVAPGDRLLLAGAGVEIEMVAKSGRSARLVITAPREVRIERVADHAKHEMIASHAVG